MIDYKCGKFVELVGIVYVIADLKVHVPIVHCKGRQGSNMRPREQFFWVRESTCVLGERFSEKKLTWDPHER